MNLNLTPDDALGLAALVTVGVLLIVSPILVIRRERTLRRAGQPSQFAGTGRGLVILGACYLGWLFWPWSLLIALLCGAILGGAYMIALAIATQGKPS